MTRHALLVGVSQFDDPNLPHLNAPGEDIKALADLLVDPARGKFDHVAISLDEDVAAIREKLSALLTDRVPSDSILFYYSGHGITKGANRLFLATRATRASNPWPHSLPASEVREQINDTRAGQQVIILDCCHSGAFAEGAKGTEAPVTEQTFALGAGAEGQYVMMSCNALQVSLDASVTQLSRFTSWLVDGLGRGDAAPFKPVITMDDLFSYVSRRAQEVRAVMTSTKFVGRAVGDLVIAANPGARAPELPSELADKLADDDWRVRLAAVDQLEDVMRDPRLRSAARKLVFTRLAVEERRDVAERLDGLIGNTTPSPNAARLAEEQRQAEEKRRAVEAVRQAEERRQAAEAAGLVEEATKAAEEKSKDEETARLAEEQRKAEEAARQKAERAMQEARDAAKRRTDDVRPDLPGTTTTSDADAPNTDVQGPKAGRLESRKHGFRKRLLLLPLFVGFAGAGGIAAWQWQARSLLEQQEAAPDEQRRADQAARQADEQRRADQAARQADEQRRADQAARQGDEQRRADQAARQADEQRRADQAARQADERRKAEEAGRQTEKGTPPPARRGPYFSCDEAREPVELLICQDTKLASLDLDMNDLYRAKQAQLSPDRQQQLRFSQRNWIKDRNDCVHRGAQPAVRDCVLRAYLDGMGALRSF